MKPKTKRCFRCELAAIKRAIKREDDRHKATRKQLDDRMATILREEREYRHLHMTR
jgi:hypothetical protein